MPIAISKSESPIRFKFPDLVQLPAVPTATSGAAPAPPAATVTTNGWDTVFAIRLPDVNKAIRKFASSPKSYSQSKVYGTGANPLTVDIKGTFGDWQLSQGGSGSLIFMAIPLTSGTLSWMGTDYPYSQGVATISVHLQYTQQTTEAGASTDSPGTPMALRVQTSATPSATVFAAANAETVKPVTVESLTWNGTQPDSIVAPFLRDMLEMWFRANMSAFNHTFAVVDINATASKDAWQFLKPKALGYAYAQPGTSPDDDDCVFGVLALTDSTDSSAASWQITPDAIPAGARAGFLVGGPTYLEKVLRPDLPSSFQDAKASDFAVSPGTTQLTNVKKVTMAKLKDYTPILTPNNFTADLKAGQLQVSIRRAHVAISPGIDLYLDYTIHSGCKLKAKDDGTQALVLYDVDDIEYDHEVQVAAGVTISEVAAGLIVGVVTAGIGNAGGKAATKALAEAYEVAEDSLTAKIVRWIINAIVSGIVGGLVGNIDLIIKANAEQKASDLPPFDPFAKEATSSTAWAGGKGLALTSVEFNSTLQLGVDPQFVDS